MILREFLEQVNGVLKANMKKKVIEEGFNDYDTINGRKVITEHNLKDIIKELDKDNIIGHIKIERGVNLTFLGVDFKLKRKKSDITSKWHYTNQLTYSEILLNPFTPNKEQLLNMELSDIRKQYIDKMNEEERLRKEVSQNKVESFKNKLSELGITTSQFKELLSDYNNLNWNEKEDIK